MTDLAEMLKAQDASIDADDDFDAINRLYMEHGWGDGLPIVPPTAERVEAMLEYCDRPIDKPIAKVAPRYGEATPLRLAANAVMAGCEPRYFPLYMLAIEAMCDEPFNLYGVQATTHLCAPLVIVNGPIVQELGLNAGHNAFGPGTKSNATIGRALRLISINVLGVKHGSLDASSFGHPGKYSLCFAEDDPPAPWEPLRVELGYEREDTTVTLVPTEGPRQVANMLNEDPEGVLRTYVSYMKVAGQFITGKGGQAVVIMGPEHALAVRQAGWTKDQIREFFLAESRVFPEELEAAGVIIERGSQHKMETGDDGKLATLGSVDDLFVLTAGGEGAGWSSYIPTWAPKLHSRSVTRRVRVAGEALPDCGPDACEVVLPPLDSERSAS